MNVVPKGFIIEFGIGISTRPILKAENSNQYQPRTTNEMIIAIDDIVLFCPTMMKQPSLGCTMPE